MPHLLAYKSGATRHLARWNNSPTSAARHLGAGKVVFTLSRDAYRHFTWGNTINKQAGSSTIPVAVGYTDAFTLAGERAVAETLRGAVASGDSAWPYMGNDWAESNFEPPAFWYACGGLGLSQENYVGTRSEAVMSITAKHFSLPADAVAAVAAGCEISARVKVKGVGAWVQPNTRDLSRPNYCDLPTIEDNPNYFGGTGSSAYTRRILFETYQDALSLAVHCIGGSLSKSSFNPLQCFFVRSVNPGTGAVTWYDLKRLCASHEAYNGGMPTETELLNYYGVDMLNDPSNSHWIDYLWNASRSRVSSNTSRFDAQIWAMNNGGSIGNTPVFTSTAGGSGWGPLFIGGAAWNPHDSSQNLFQDFQLAPFELDQLANGGVWIIATQLPMLTSTGYGRNDFASQYTQRTHLPSAATTFEFGPCVNSIGSASNLQGKQMCTEVLSVADVGLEVTLG